VLLDLRPYDRVETSLLLMFLTTITMQYFSRSGSTKNITDSFPIVPHLTPPSASTAGAVCFAGLNPKRISYSADIKLQLTDGGDDEDGGWVSVSSCTGSPG